MYDLLTPFFITVGQGQVALLSWLTAPVRFFFCLFVWLCEWVLQHHWGGWAGESPWPWPELVLLRTHKKKLNRRRQLLTYNMKEVVRDEKYSSRRLLCNNPNFFFIYFFLRPTSAMILEIIREVCRSRSSCSSFKQLCYRCIKQKKEEKNDYGLGRWPSQNSRGWVTKHFISVLFIPSSLRLRISSCKV